MLLTNLLHNNSYNEQNIFINPKKSNSILKKIKSFGTKSSLFLAGGLLTGLMTSGLLYGTYCLSEYIYHVISSLGVMSLITPFVNIIIPLVGCILLINTLLLFYRFRYEDSSIKTSNLIISLMSSIICLNFPTLLKIISYSI